MRCGCEWWSSMNSALQECHPVERAGEAWLASCRSVVSRAACRAAVSCETSVIETRVSRIEVGQRVNESFGKIGRRRHAAGRAGAQRVTAVRGFFVRALARAAAPVLAARGAGLPNAEAIETVSSGWESRGGERSRKVGARGSKAVEASVPERRSRARSE
jgi:hypothetical protein